MYCIILEMHNLWILFCAYRNIVLQSALLHFFHAIYVRPVLCRLIFARPYWPPLLSISRTAPDWFTPQMVGQWQIAYLLRYGSHCIARGGLLTCSGMAHIVLYCQWWIAYLLSYGLHCIASGGLLTCSAMAHIVLSAVCFIPPQQLWLTLYCQWWVAYLLRYGSQVGHVCIAICG